MKKIVIKPAWSFISETGEHVDPQLFDLLRAIHDTRKLTLAAARMKLSYCHAWHLLGKWSAFFGSPLVHKERGKGARLTELGSKLLWAEQRSDASLFPQLENIASELNIQISLALKKAQSIIRIHASHGYAVEKLPALMQTHGSAAVDLQYMGSIAALQSLHRSDCDLAAFHLPVGSLKADLWHHYERWIAPRHQRVIRLVTRSQGLMVAKDNPLRIFSFADLTRSGVRFVNRQRESGTRFLLDRLLQSLGIDSKQIAGYETGEFTHAAVAAFIASGMADAAFGVEPAARQFGLDFLPIVAERYMLVANVETLRLAPVKELVALLRGQYFRELIGGAPGYAPDNPGAIVTIEEI